METRCHAKDTCGLIFSNFTGDTEWLAGE